MRHTTRRQFIAAGAAFGAVGVAGCGLVGGDDVSHEIWAADQGTNTLYVYEPAGDDGTEFEQLAEIDTAAEGGEVPHMISYSSDYEYAAVACTAGARTLVYRTEDRELVGNVETGPGSHFAGFTPDDDAIVVDVIGESRIVRIDADLESESFEIDDAIDIGEDVEGLTADEGAPVCHSYDHDGRSIHTLGPSYHAAGLIIVDHDAFEVDVAFTGEELPTNCGTVSHPTEDKFYLTAGLPSDPEADEEGVGAYYVLDTSSDEILVDGVSTGGVDAHGFWFTPDAEELWVLNRETNDGVVVDPDTDEVVDEIDSFGPDADDSPDIMWASPDGQYIYVTLRGGNPVSGDPHAATGVNPGFAALDVESREVLDAVIPDGDDPDSDFHGIGVRPTESVDGYTSPPY